MTKIFKYQRITTPGPDGTTLYFKNSETELKAVELAEFEGWSYVSVPDGVILPDQFPDIQWQEAVIDPVLRAQIMTVSRPVQLINQGVVARIRDQYSVDDELKLLRTAPSAEFEIYNAHAEDCRAWGREQKTALGL